MLYIDERRNLAKVLRTIYRTAETLRNFSAAFPNRRKPCEIPRRHFRERRNSAKVPRNVSRTTETLRNFSAPFPPRQKPRETSSRDFHHRRTPAKLPRSVPVAKNRPRKTYARQYVVRESTMSEYSFVSSCQLIDAQRSDVNPHGLLIEKFRVLENNLVETRKR